MTNTLAEKEGVETTAENQGGSGASVKPEAAWTVEEALQESAYRSGMRAGWNFAISDDGDGYQRRMAYNGYLKPITEKRRAERAAIAKLGARP